MITKRKPLSYAVLPVEIKNKNNGQGHHWGKSASDKKRFQRELKAFTREPLTFRVDVVVTRIIGKGQRLYDPDSIGRGNAKQIIDTLTELGWWVDDSAKYLRHVDYRQDDSKRAEGPCTLIEIFKVDE